MGQSAGVHDGADEWMSQLEDDRRINTLCIPGTHDTMAMYDSITSKVAGSLGTCQNDTLSEQLSYGARAFDIRLVHTHDENLQCYHGKWGAKGVDQESNFMDVCKIFNKFLTDHPKEMIIAKIKRESINKDLVDPPPFDQVLYNNLIESKLPYWIPGSAKKSSSEQVKNNDDKDDGDKGVETKYDNNNDNDKKSANSNTNSKDTFNNYLFPTLGECRGKVIILTAFPTSGKVDQLGYVFKEMSESDDKGSKKKKSKSSHQHGKFYFENDWKGPNRVTKLRKIKKHIRKARKQEGDIFYVSYMSATKAVSITKCRCQATDNPKDYSRALGPKMEKYLNNNCCGKDPPGIGIIFFDFGLLPNNSCKISCCNAIALATCTPTCHFLPKYNMYSAVYNVNFREQIPWPRTRCCLYVTCCCWLWDVICCPSICYLDCDHDRWVC